MKIVILTDSLSFKEGGAIGVAYTSAKTLVEKGHDVHIITTCQTKKESGFQTKNNLNIHRLYTNYNHKFRPYVSLYNRQTKAPLKKILKEIKPDIVHAHNIHLFLSYNSLKIAKNTGAKVFLTSHDVMPVSYHKLPGRQTYKVSFFELFRQAKFFACPFRNKIIRYYFKKYTDAIFTVSDALKEVLNQNKINNVFTINNGINVTKWHYAQQNVDDFRKKYNLKNKKIILCGGRMSFMKGGEKIMLALKIICSKEPGVTLLLLSRKEAYVIEMEKMAKKNGMQKNLLCTDWITGSELKAAYQSSDVVVVPSVCFDSFPTINLEAFACKKPIVATCFGGSKELVDDDINGYIVNPHNVEIMAKKILDLLQNSEKKNNFGKAGYNKIIKNFTLDEQYEKTLKFYKRG